MVYTVCVCVERKKKEMKERGGTLDLVKEDLTGGEGYVKEKVSVCYKFITHHFSNPTRHSSHLTSALCL